MKTLERMMFCFFVSLLTFSGYFSLVSSAIRKIRCIGAPFSFTNIQTIQFMLVGNHLQLQWMAAGSTQLECSDASPDGATLDIDV